MPGAKKQPVEKKAEKPAPKTPGPQKMSKKTLEAILLMDPSNVDPNLVFPAPPEMRKPYDAFHRLPGNNCSQSYPEPIIDRRIKIATLILETTVEGVERLPDHRLKGDGKAPPHLVLLGNLLFHNTKSLNANLNRIKRCFSYYICPTIFQAEYLEQAAVAVLELPGFPGMIAGKREATTDGFPVYRVTPDSSWRLTGATSQPVADERARESAQVAQNVESLQLGKFKEAATGCDTREQALSEQIVKLANTPKAAGALTNAQKKVEPTFNMGAYAKAWALYKKSPGNHPNLIIHENGTAEFTDTEKKRHFIILDFFGKGQKPVPVQSKGQKRKVREDEKRNANKLAKGTQIFEDAEEQEEARKATENLNISTDD